MTKNWFEIHSHVGEHGLQVGQVRGIEGTRFLVEWISDDGTEARVRRDDLTTVTKPVKGEEYSSIFCPAEIEPGDAFNDPGGYSYVFKKGDDPDTVRIMCLHYGRTYPGIEELRWDRENDVETAYAVLRPAWERYLAWKQATEDRREGRGETASEARLEAIVRAVASELGIEEPFEKDRFVSALRTIKKVFDELADDLDSAGGDPRA